MQVRIVEKRFSGVEFAPEMRVLHLGGQSSANVEQLKFTLPESWKGKSVTLHIQQQDGTLPTPILLDENLSCAVGKEFTASPCGEWMLLALGEDGFRALTRPAKYDCYETLATDGDAEISPTQYETFVARVLAQANSAQDAAKEARNSASSAAASAAAAGSANTAAQTAAGKAGRSETAAQGYADRAEAAAQRAEEFAPAEDGPVTAINGKGGNVTLSAADVGAVDENSAGYIRSMSITGQTVTLLLGDGSTKTLQTKDTTALTSMTGILSTEHGGTGKNTALTAEDVGAYSKSESYRKTEVYSRSEADSKFGTPYTLPAATADRLGGVKIGSGLSVTGEGVLSASGGGLSAYPVGSIYMSTSATNPAELFGGTWEQIASERVLMGASDAHAAGTTAEAGLPNITGNIKSIPPMRSGYTTGDGAFADSKGSRSTAYADSGSAACRDISFDASRSSAVYGNSDTVQPAAYYVYIWHRVA